MRLGRKSGLWIALTLCAFGALVALVARYPVNVGVVDAETEAALEQRLLALVPTTPTRPVEPLLPIETCWDIEDELIPAEAPLVTALQNDGGALGYDAVSRTFYCPLGLGLEAWPALTLTAGGAVGLRVAFADDYAWDDVADAVRKGTAYRLLCWTEDKYEYVNLVFTGLPIFTLRLEDWATIDDEYMPAYATVSEPGFAPVASIAEAHLRSGGDNREHQKLGYRVSFRHITRKGRIKELAVDMPDMGEGTDWLLIPSPLDDTCLKDHLGWQLWNAWNADGNAFALLQSRMVELFVDDQYEGIYELLQPIEPEEELSRIGKRDGGYAARLILDHNLSERAVSDQRRLIYGYIELRCAPKGVSDSDALAHFDDFALLSARPGPALEDEDFLRLAEERADVREVLSYWLFFQFMGLRDDNVWHNVWVWALPEGNTERYAVSPWDMDVAFQEQETGLNRSWALPVRLLELDVLDSRRIAHEIFAEKRAGVASDDALWSWLEEEVNALRESGAYARETERWGEERARYAPNLGEPAEDTLTRLFSRMQDRIAALESALANEWPIEETP